MIKESRMRILVVCYVNEAMGKMSYHEGWAANFPLHRLYDCTVLNLACTGFLKRLWNKIHGLNKDFDAVVFLHSVYANSNRIDKLWEAAFQGLDAPKVYFMANEYKHIKEKVELANRLGSKMLVSQTSNQDVLREYEKVFSGRVISFPHAGLDPSVFSPASSKESRLVDLGYIAASEPYYFGHQERKIISDYFIQHANELKLKTDINYNNESRRLNRKGFAAFLNQCKGQIGSEAGTDFFEIDGSKRAEVISYVEQHPDWDMESLDRLFFSRWTRLPCRMISGRILEAAGTKTVQVLFKGYYNGYFKPDIHYISLNKDFSNIDDVMRRFRDKTEVTRIVETAYELARSEMTYEKLLDRMYEEISKLS